MDKIIFLLTFLFSMVLTYVACSQITFHELKWQANHLLYQANLTEVKIPKIIHYVWVGSEEPESVKKSIANWHQHLPDWKMIRWDETNCDIKANKFVREAYERKAWQWVADWCRIQALYQYGGLYLDTDQLLTKNPEPLLTKSLILGYETKSSITGSFIGVKEKHSLMKMMIDYYQKQEFSKENIPVIIYEKLNKYLQNKNDKNDLKMLSFNEIMIDFGGSENYAEHYYANGNKDFMERGYFYQFFADNYLNQFSYHLKETPKGNVYANVIILPNNQFYLVRLQHKYHYLRYYADKPRQEGTYKIKKQNKQKLLELNFNTGKTEYFVCQKLKCIKRTNHSNH